VRALAAIRKRHPDAHVLEAVTAIILNEHQSAPVRKAAVECFADVVELRRAGCLLEVLRSARSPLPVRAAAFVGLKKLGYPELLERLVEAALFGQAEDPRGEIRRWALHELTSLDEHEKLTKVYEILHGRRKLYNRSFTTIPGGRVALIPILVHIDSKGCQRFLAMMSDDENPAVREAAAEALHALRAQGHGSSVIPPPPG
jgi:HEAT repeat protein